MLQQRIKHQKAEMDLMHASQTEKADLGLMLAPHTKKAEILKIPTDSGGNYKNYILYLTDHFEIT